MKKGFKQLLVEANEAVVTYTPAEAMVYLNKDDIVFVDIRDAPELKRDGKIPGAVHASRGMLEFLVDPESLYHDPIFASSKKFLFYCASGGRSAFAAQRMQEMGLEPAAHMSDGLKGWKEIAGPIEGGQQNGN
jgi:rhodanese-related sulfurtransferase